MESIELPKFKINYNKTKPIILESLEKDFVLSAEDVEHKYNAFQIKQLQSYNPIYSKFFTLTDTNYNRISLNHKYHMSTMSTVIDQETKNVVLKSVFIKFSPLLDPIRYMIGKYNYDDISIRTLPKITSDTTAPPPHAKIADSNNVSYIDNFFSFLTSSLLHHHNVLNGVDYYGSYLGIQDKFKMNITDDIEYLNTSAHFIENNKKMYAITNSDTKEYLNFGSRANKHRLVINNDANHSISAINIVDLDIITELEITEGTASIVLASEINDTVGANQTDLVYEKLSSSSSVVSSQSSSSDDSSTNSETNYSTDDDDDSTSSKSNDDSHSHGTSSDNDEESSWESVDSNENEEDCQYAFINNFPVQLICLEKCNGTLDELFDKDQVNVDEAGSILFQIIMTLIAYQKAFHFTHNDLHTNNIMYINTDIEYLYYQYKNRMYKVPTYGKIYKIIDFGRSIYRFNGHLFCSDSFATGGDAATQYNCEPYMNDKKPRLDPNYSFDLARLGCSLYDFIIDDDDNPADFDELQKTVYRWCTDDNNKNILYKKDGDERYPNFKLYKMIARTSHKHTPQEQLEFPYFKQFLISSKQNVLFENLIDLDKLPCYV